MFQLKDFASIAASMINHMRAAGSRISDFSIGSVARTLGGATAGPAGAVIGMALPVVLPAVARRMGPAGMVAAAVGGLLFSRWL